MILPRAIACSFFLHGVILGCAFLGIGPSVDLAPAPVENLPVVDYELVDREVPVFNRPDRPRRSPKSEFAALDLEAGLDGNSESEPESNGGRKSSREPRSDSASDGEIEEAASSEGSTDSEPSSRASKSEKSASANRSEARESPPEDREQKKTASTSQSNSPPESPSASPGSEGRVARNENSKGGSPGGERGEGSGFRAGDGDGKGKSGGSNVDRGTLIRGYARKLYRRLAQERDYPRSARRAGVEGTVKVVVRIDSEGNVLSVEVDESSGFEILDRAALETLRSIDKLPPPPKALTWNEKRLRIPIRYQLDKRG